MATTLLAQVPDSGAMTAKIFAASAYDTLVESVALTRGGTNLAWGTGSTTATGLCLIRVVDGSNVTHANWSAVIPASGTVILGDMAGVDWQQVANATSTVGLTGTTISTSQQVASVSGAVGSVTGAVGSIGAGGIAAASFAAGAVDAAAVAADAGTEIATAVWASGTRTLTSVSGLTADCNVVQISGDATAADNLEAMLDGTGGTTLTTGITGNITGNLSGTVGSVTGSVGSVVGAVGSVTGNVGGNVLGSVATIGSGGIAAASFVAGAIDAAAIATDAFGALELAAGAASEIATAVRTELATELARVDATISSRLAPTVSGRTLDVTTTGEAGIDWANVGSATATVGLTNTTVGTVSAATIGAGGITSSTFAAGAIDANAIATDAIGALELAAGAASEVASAVRTELATELGRIDAAVTSRMAGYTQPTGFLTTEFGATVATSASVSAVDTRAQDIQARLPAALTAGGNIKADVLKINGQATSFVQKNQALASFPFLMTESTYHLPATGKTVTVTRSIDGGAFAAGTLSAVSELSNGVYLVSFGAGDLNGTTILLRATATGCDDTFERIVTQP